MKHLILTVTRLLLVATAALALASCAMKEPVAPRPGLNQTSTGEVVAPLPWAHNGDPRTTTRMGMMSMAPDRSYY